MNLLTPDTGLLFWMLVTFGVVVFVLAKYGFPVVLKMVDKRNAFIEESLAQAEKARAELADVKIESDKIIANAKQEQREIIVRAEQTGKTLIDEAKNRAAREAEKLLDETRAQISHERDLAIGDIRRQVAELSVMVAEKALMEKLNNSAEQERLLNHLLDEMTISKS